MKKQTIYVFLDTRTEDAAVTLDPITYEGIDDWEQIGEVSTIEELKELLHNQPFDPEYRSLLLQEMPRDIYTLLTK